LPAWCVRTVLASALIIAAGVQAQSTGQPNYRLGDTAKVDIVTPIELFVYDAERTEQARRAEAQRVPPVLRFYPNVLHETEQELRTAFAAARRLFLDFVAARFERRLLATSQLGELLFAEAIGDFSARNRNFPLSRSLAELWALGDSGEIVLESWLGRLAELTNQYVRDDVLPANQNLSAVSIQIVAVNDGAPSPDLAAVEQQDRSIARTNLVTLSEVRQKFWQTAASEEKPVAFFLNGFARPNCVFDSELTHQARAKRLEVVHAVDHYTAGQVIAKRGQAIDLRIQGALAELQARTAVAGVRAKPEQEKPKLAVEAGSHQRGEPDGTQVGNTPTPHVGHEIFGPKQETRVATSVAGVQAQAITGVNKPLVLWLTFASGSCAVFAWLWLRRQPRAAALVTAVPSLRADATIDLGWRERALAAEARADKAAALLRARLLPHLARWMMRKMFQRVLWQRGALLSSQQRAEHDMANLAERLDSVHALLEERLNAYEQRITELEAELALKDQENRELIRAKLEWTRQKLTEERAQLPTTWN